MQMNEKKTNVLLVEDNPSDAFLIQHELRLIPEHGLDITVVSRLDEALAKLTDRRLDVVLLDLGVPGSTGFETFIKIREKLPHIPIVVLTGADNEAAGVEAIRKEAQDYLIKGVNDGKTIARSIRYAIERKQAEAALQAKNDELAIANREFEEFSFSMAHDLRNPLNAVIACCSILSNDPDSRLDRDMCTAVDHITNSARRMARIISDLLELSKITRREMFVDNVNLSEIARSVFVQLQASDTERTIEIDIAPDLFAEADPRLAVILMEHLIGNAWKYTARIERARIQMNRMMENGRECFYVRDNGVGFDGTLADRLFKPFHRLHSDKEFEGTGIGLAIVKKIVDRHGGFIRAEGQPGKGATLYFRLER
jgi:light-regulated signal transduction histidine kinase (bacteriophytochrome)